MRKHTQRELAAELEDLRARLAEAEEVLRAIRNGEVDAVVVAGERGEQVYTLSGADRIYRQFIETMSEGAVTLSADGVILYCNVRLAEMLGRPLDQVLGSALRNHLSSADQQALDAILTQARTEPSGREISLKTSEGRLVPVYLSAFRLHSEGAEMVFCLVFTDLTEQKRHEEIVVAERLARLILEQAAEAIIVCDEQGLVIRASQAAQRLCEGSPLLRPFAEVFPLRTDASGPFHLAPVLQGQTLRNVDVALDRQGQKLDLILTAGPLLSSQQILGCVVALTNITERKKAEAALRQSEELFRSLFEHHAAVKLLIDPDTGNIVDANDAAERFYGWPRERLKHMRIQDINTLPPEEVKAEMEKVRAQARIHFEFRHRRADGSIRDVEVFSSKITAKGKDLLHSIVHDVSERKRIERENKALEAQLRQRQKLEAVGTLAGGVAHEINNPINGIMNYAQLIADTAAPESRVAEYAGEIVHETERVATIVRNLLQFARQEPQAHSLVRPADIVEQTLSLLRAVFRRHQITLTVDMPEGLPLLKCRSQQIQQVLMNLLTNARDALNEKYPSYHPDKTITVTCRPFDQGDRRWLRVTVADRGTGIPPEIQDRIFDPFFTTKPRDKGTGLGLSISHGIAKDHHGALHFETAPGTGTQFHLDLPVDEEE
jgi:PAS domain S-box-containing protein